MGTDGFVSIGSQWLPARCTNNQDGTFTCVVKYSEAAQAMHLVSLTIRLPDERVKLETPKQLGNDCPDIVITSVLPSSPGLPTCVTPQCSDEKNLDEKEEMVEALAQEGMSPSNPVAAPLVKNSGPLPADAAMSGEGAYCLRASVDPEFQSFTFDEVSREFHGILTVSAPKVPAEKSRPGVDAVCVLDVSGSMAGDKISLVRKAMRRLVQNMGEKDRVAFVTFDTLVHTLMPFRTMDEAGKDHAYMLIKKLQEGSCTNLCGGLVTGMELMNKHHQNEVTTVLLFTDGQANSGITVPKEIIDAALRVVGKADPKDWDVNDVVGWLNRLGLGLYAHSFAQNGVDGAMLLHDISDKILEEELGVKSMHLNKFSRELQKIRASTCRGEGESDHFFMQVNTFGFGGSHNAELLKGIAEQFDGMYYYMKDDMAIVEGFANCLGGMLSTVAQDIEAVLAPASGVSDFIVRKKNAKTNLDGSSTVTFADLQAEEKRQVLVQGTLPALDGPNSAFPVFHAKIQYRNLVENEDCSVNVTCSLPRTGVKGAMVKDLDECRNRINATEAMELADQLGNARNLEEARNTIQKAIQSITGSVSADTDFCKSIIKDLNRCLEGLKDQLVFKDTGSRYIAQNVMCHENQRAANFDANFSSQMAYNNNTRQQVTTSFKRRHHQDSCGGVACLFGDDDYDDSDSMNVPPPAPTNSKPQRASAFNDVAHLFGGDDDGNHPTPPNRQASNPPSNHQANFGGVASLFGDVDSNSASTSNPPSNRRQSTFGGVASLFDDVDNKSASEKKSDVSAKISPKPSRVQLACEDSGSGVADLFGFE